MADLSTTRLLPDIHPHKRAAREIKLFLDDERMPPTSGWIIARNFEDFMSTFDIAIIFRLTMIWEWIPTAFC